MKSKRAGLSAFTLPGAAILLLLFFTSCARDPRVPVVRSFFLMDTYVTIKAFPAPGARAEAETIIERAAARMRAIDSLSDNYWDDSEISRLNHHAGAAALPLSADMRAMLTAALRVDSLSGGAFTPVVGRLTELWGFGRRDSMRVPPESERLQAVAHTGRQAVQLQGGHLRFLDPLARLDLGGIAKGYAVDAAIALLQENGISDAQVDAGGDLRTLASAATAGRRKIYVRHPALHEAFFGRFPLDQGAVATSGDYERFFEVDGVRYHHLLDPATGMPARGCHSVTIIGSEATLCDALATAVFVLGPEKGMQLIEALPGIEGLILTETAGTLQAGLSSGLTSRFEQLSQ